MSRWWRAAVVGTIVAVTPLPAGASSSPASEPASTAASLARPLVPAPARAFGWPLRPLAPVSRAFQPPSTPYGPGHRGADLATTVGRPVLSAGDGVVVYAGPLADRGVVSVEHTGGLRTSYEPLRAEVRPGQVVARGERLGTLAAGHQGCPAPACLHWGLRRDGRYLDPLVLVRPGHVRLLPYPPDS